MYLPSALLFALFATFAAAIALPQANQDGSEAQALQFDARNKTTTAATPLRSEVTCFDEREAPPISDCSKAMLEFPHDLRIQEFHLGGEADIFRLPAQRLIGQCLMTIELPDGNPELSSWLAIGTVALQLTMACAGQRLQFGFGHTGGYTTMGGYGRIKVTLAKHKGMSDEGPLASGNNSLDLMTGKAQLLHESPA
ncbi:MAG: hypothetical protein Q9163_001076 [Psora crenata]